MIDIIKEKFMNKLSKTATVLSLVGSIIETVVAFSVYWTFFALAKTNTIAMTSPVIVLICGILGGVIGIIGGALVKSSKLAGVILMGIAAILQLFGTIFLIAALGLEGKIGDVVMIILPFFVIPNALTLSGGVIGFVSLFKNEEEKAA